MICPLSSLTLLLPLPLLTLTPLALTIIFLYMYSSHTNTYFILFFCDAIHTCNSLPYSVMSLPSLNSFKKTVIVVLLLCCFFYFWVHTQIRTTKKTTAKKQFPRTVPRLVLVQLSLNVHCQCRHSHHLIGVLGRKTILELMRCTNNKA